MMQKRAYPRTPLERQGQVNLRRDTSPAAVERRRWFNRQIQEPDCVINVTKRKETFGLLDNRESQPMSLASSEIMFNHFPQHLFFRYRVRVYLKQEWEKGNEEDNSRNW
jgi:hypothetical protein